MSRRSLYFWTAVALQVLVLVGMTGIRAYTLATGTRVLLKTLPLDPRDPFRGDFVRLRYEISELHADQVRLTEHEYREGEAIWVVLEPGAPYWRAVAAGPERPAAAPGQVVVRGQVRYYATWPEPLPPDAQRSGRERQPEREAHRLGLEYGIESFFVPEGEGHKLERPEVQLEIEAAVDRFGRAAIARAFVEGKELKFE